MPAAQVVSEDATLSISGISVSDPEGDLSTVQLSVTQGMLTVTLSGSATISSGAMGSNTLTLSGTEADINATLATLTYQGDLDYVGADTLTVLSTDALGGSDSDTVAITVLNENDAAVLTASAGATSYAEQGAALVIDSGLTLVDSDGFDGTDPSDQYNAVVRISGNYDVNDILGFVDTANISGSLAGDTLILSVINGQTATVAEFEDAVQSVTFYNGSDNPSELNRTIAFSFDDGVDSSNVTTKTVQVGAINDDPTNTGSLPTDVTVTEDAMNSIDLSSFVLQDVDANNQLVTVTLATATGGTITASSDFDVTVYGSGSGILTLVGGVSDLNNFFSSASRFWYDHATQHMAGDNADTISVSVNDQGNTGTGGSGTVLLGTVSVDITAVNDAPVLIAGTANDLTVNEDSGLTSLGLGTIDYGVGGGADESGQTLSYEITVIPDPTYFGRIYLADGTSQVSTGFYSIEQIRGMQFEPALNENGGPSFFSYKVADSGGGTDTYTETIQLDITAVNDSPVNTLPGAQVVAEDSAFGISGISVSDPDGTLSTVQLSVTGGTLTVAVSGSATISSGAVGSDTLTLSGTEADINATLATLSYQGDLNYVGADTVTVLSTDVLGATDSGTVAITVTSVDDAPTFDVGDGIATTDAGIGNNTGQSVSVQADGKILVAGQSWNGVNWDLTVTRYNADGPLDTSFGGDGIVMTDIGGRNDDAYSVTTQPDGKILVSGRSKSATDYDFVLVRYNVDGTLDTSFSADGIVTTDIGSANDIGLSTTVQSDGKILVSGYGIVAGNYDFAVVRYNVDGSLDTGFGGGGIVSTDVGSGMDSAIEVTVQDDGKVLLSGYSNNGTDNDLALVRYNTDGTLDTGFGTNGAGHDRHQLGRRPGPDHRRPGGRQDPSRRI